MTRQEAIELKKAFEADPKLQALKKSFTTEEKTYKKLLKKLTDYTVKYNNSKKKINKLAGEIHDQEYKIQYK